MGLQNRRFTFFILGGLLCMILLTTHHVRPDLTSHALNTLSGSRLPPPPPQSDGSPPPPEVTPKPFKEEIFPLAKEGRIPNVNPKNVVHDNDRRTPLLIGFTRNWYLLEQSVVSYITAGWPAAEITVIDNSGVMDSNLRGLLSPRNPWYLNHTRLNQLGVTVKRTPTLLTFAQLQNFFINYAIEQAWPVFFWSHMDVIALGEEHLSPYKSFYSRVVDCLKDVKPTEHWAMRFFAYDWLTLVNVDAMKDVGGWDPQIPYYMTDCDMYERLFQKNYTQNNCRAGFIYDVAEHLDDLGVLYPKEGEEDLLDSERYKNLVKELDQMQKNKHENKKGRNTWQAAQNGGQGEPFWRHPQGFERAINFWIEKGRELFGLKWGYPNCDIIKQGRKTGDEWRYKDLTTLQDYN